MTEINGLGILRANSEVIMMNTFITAALLMVTVSSFANDTNERSSVDSFLSILPIGEYQGKSDSGVECLISVDEVNFPEKAILITGKNSQNKVTKTVKEGSEFFFRAYKKEFIQTDRYFVDASRSAYFEKVVRTVSAGDDLLYVVVALDTNINGNNSSEKVECVISNVK